MYYSCYLIVVICVVRELVYGSSYMLLYDGGSSWECTAVQHEQVFWLVLTDIVVRFKFMCRNSNPWFLSRTNSVDIETYITVMVFTL